MNALNLGCGRRYHPDWENVDFIPVRREIKCHDLRKPLPYPDASFDVLYHSHVLEHFPKEAGLQFMRECYRLLRPGGIIRVVVPDLEQIARLYLEALEKASAGLNGWNHNYQWMILEMYDQAVRERIGGECVEYFRQDPISNWDFILQRWGKEQAKLTLEYSRNKPQSQTAWHYVLRNPGAVLRQKLIRIILGNQDWEALNIGRFRRSGEIHMWMYDKYSLTEALKHTGFVNPQRKTATDSNIPSWEKFNLDSEPDGTIYKPDSIYLEANRSI